MTSILDLSGVDLEKELSRIIKSAKQRRRYWTAKEDLVLKRLYEAGVSYSKMAEVLGRSKASISGELNAIKD